MQVLFRDILVGVIIIAVLIGCFDLQKKQRVMSWHNLGILVFVLCITTAFSLTGISPISGFHADLRLNDVNVIPFVGMIEMLADGDPLYAVVNLVGNALLFAPVGFFLPLLWKPYNCKKKKLWRVVLIGFCITFLVEFSQLFLCRGTDIDDIILNVLGVFIGYGVSFLFTKWFPGFAEKFSTYKQGICGKIELGICIFVPYVVIVLLGFYDRMVYFKM